MRKFRNHGRGARGQDRERVSCLEPKTTLYKIYLRASPAGICWRLTTRIRWRWTNANDDYWRSGRLLLVVLLLHRRRWHRRYGGWGRNIGRGALPCQRKRGLGVETLALRSLLYLSTPTVQRRTEGGRSCSRPCYLQKLAPASNVFARPLC